MPTEWRQKLPKWKASLTRVQSGIDALLNRSRLNSKGNVIAEQAMRHLEKAKDCLDELQQIDERQFTRPQLTVLPGGRIDPNGDNNTPF